MLTQVLLAVVPIAWLIIAMTLLKMSGVKACGIGLLITAAECLAVYKMGALEVATGAAEGAIAALWPICIIIVAAMFTYNMSLHTGAMDIIKGMLGSVSNDKRIVALILDLAGKESFVIIGRAANAILADHPNTLRLYVYASDSFKIPRVKEYYHLDSEKEEKKKMEQVDKIRQNYFNYYSDMAWGSSDGHDFMIDTSVFGIDGAVDIIIDLAERKFGKIA